MNETERTLVLMRHAKSSYPEGVVDHERPLAPRGQREAGLAGTWIRDHVAPIERVLCSSATRTRETLGLTGIDAPVHFLDRLYGATPGTLINEVNAVDDALRTLLVVGHEPTMSQVALGLAAPDRSNRTVVDDISMKFPTSGIAVLRLPGSWSDLQLGSAALVAFHVPR